MPTAIKPILHGRNHADHRPLISPRTHKGRTKLAVIAAEHVNQWTSPSSTTNNPRSLGRNHTKQKEDHYRSCAVIVHEHTIFSWVQSNKTTKHDPPKEERAWEGTPNPAPERETRKRHPSLSAGGRQTRTNRACTRVMLRLSSRGSCTHNKASAIPSLRLS